MVSDIPGHKGRVPLSKPVATFRDVAAVPEFRALWIAHVLSLLGDYLAIRAKDGKVLWRIGLGQEEGACYATAAVTTNAIIFSTRGDSVMSLNPANGKTLWTFRAKGGVDSSPVVAGSTIFVGCDDGVLYGLELKTGKKVWHFTAGAEIKASPAIAQQRMVIGSGDGAVYCFGK